MGLWDTIKNFFGGPSAQPESAPGPSAQALLREMKSDKGPVDPEWTRLRNRLGTLVLSESDQQRLWKRAHRGAEQSARLLSGIRHPSADEKRILDELVKELESGR